MFRDAQRYSGALVYRLLETIFPALFHPATALSGSLRSPPSPRGEGFVSRIPLSPSNLCPFGAPPSIGRRECPREPLPLEGAAERSEAGLASFFAAKPPPLCLPPLGKALCRENPHPRFAAFPIGEGFASSVLFSGRDDATGKAILIPAPISPVHVRGLHRRF